MSDRPMLGGCCVCLDERGWAENPLVYCDGQSCNVAVHQACYGIIKVPSGPWFCRKCESQERAAKVKCELCPHRDGALKRTDNGGWAHVVCALYIPEVAFGSVSSMEPIMLQKVPADRFSKACYICEEENRSSKATTGACMSCAKLGCKTSFHVSCAQMIGLLCEEASGGNQTKYCGYCKVHLAKAKKIATLSKNAPNTMVYKLPNTSSSDEVDSQGERLPILPEANIMKPGDIRYTKAGKKRSKSLEESLAVNSPEVFLLPVNSDKILTEEADAHQLSKEQESGTADQQTITSTNASTLKDTTVSTTETQMDTDASLVVSSSQLEQNESTKLIVETNDQPASVSSKQNTPGDQPQASTGEESAQTSMTLNSLAEAAASIVSQSSTAGEDSLPSVKGKLAKKPKHATKDANQKRKKTGKKKMTAKKVESVKKKKNKTPLSGFLPCRPEPPPLTKEDPATSSGTALYPRHSVVTLAGIGLDRTEVCEAHEIGDNNKIFKPDFSIDGVTAMEKIQVEQMREGMEFFLQYGTGPEVSVLMEAVRKVKEDNRRLESTIQRMSHRRDQLLLMKSKLIGLQAPNINVETTSPQHGSAGQQSQIHCAHPMSESQKMTVSPHMPSTSHTH